MTEEERRAEVQRLIDLNTPEEEIAKFIRDNPIEVEENTDVALSGEGKLEVAVEEVAPAVTKNTALQLDFGLLELPSAKSETNDGTLILSETTVEEKEDIEKDFKSIKSDVLESIPDLVKANVENKEKRFSRGVFEKEEREEYNNWRETGEVSEDQSAISEEKIEELEANRRREFLENIPAEDRKIMVSEKEAYLKPIEEARDKGYVMINDNVNAIKQIIADYELSEEMETPYTEEQRLAAASRIKELNASVEEMYSTYLTNSALIDDESEYLDAFRRSYSNIDQLVNISKTVVTDMAIGVISTLDMLKSEEGKNLSFSENLIEYREELQQITDAKLPKAIPVSSIRNFSDMVNWGSDAIINFVPSGVMAFSGPAAMPLFFASGYGSRMAEFELEKKKAQEVIPILEKKLSETEDFNEISKIQDEIDKQNEILSTSDFNKFLVAGIYGTSEVVTEKLTTLRLVGDLKNANTVFKTKGFGKALVEKIKEFPTGPLLEGGGEGLNAIVGNWADITILGQDKSYLQGVDEAAAQGLFIGTGFKVAGVGMLGKAALLDVISDNGDKKRLKALIDEVKQLTNDLVKIENPTQRVEILRSIRNKVKNTILEQDFTGSQFLKLTEKEQQEVFESDRKARKVNKRWADVASSGISEKAKEIIRKELEAEYNLHQDNKTIVLRKSDSTLKELTEIEGLKSGDFNRKYKIYTINVAAVKRNNELRGFANKIIGVTASEIEAIQDFEGSEETSITLSDKSVLNQEDAAEILYAWDEGATGAFSSFTKNIYSFVERSIIGNPSTVLHEYFHAMALAKGFTKAQYAALRDNYVEMLNGKVKDGSITEAQLKDILDRYSQEYDGAIEKAEELINLTADAVNLDILKEDDITFLQKFAANVKSIIGTILSKEEADNYSIDTAEDAWNMVQTFSQDVLSKKEGPTVVNTGEPVEGQEEGIKESRSTVLEAINDLVPNDVKTKEEFQSARVFNPIYNSVIKEGGAINNYIKSRTTSNQETEKAIESVSDRLLNFDPEALRKEGKAVGTEAFGEFIFANTNFGKMVAKKALFKEGEKTKQEDSIDSSEATTQLANEINIDETKVKSTTSKLRGKLGINQGDKIYDLAKKVSIEILEKDLPDKKLVAFINKKARESGLTKEIYKIVGKEAAIDDVFINKHLNPKNPSQYILKDFSPRDLVKLERQNEIKVLSEQGPKLSVKEARKAIDKGLLPKDTNVKSGPRISSKLPTTLEQAKEFFTQKRKAGLVSVIVETLVKDAAPEVTENKIDEVKRNKVLSEIDREPTLKFSLNTKQDLDWSIDEAENRNTSFTIGDKTYNVQLNARDLGADQDADPTDYALEFDQDGSQELTGEGDQFKAVSIIYNSVIDEIKSNPNIATVRFNALTSEPSRVKLYNVLLDKLSTELGWDAEIFDYESDGAVDEIGFEMYKPEETTKDQFDLKFSKAIKAENEALRKMIELAKLIPGLEIISKTGAGFSNVGAGDIKATYKGKEFNIEFKMDIKAQMSGGSITYNLETENFEAVNNLPGAEEIIAAMQDKKDALNAYLKEAGLKGIGKGFNFKLNKKQRKRLKEAGLLKDVELSIKDTGDFITKINNKKGVYYIYIGGKGLYYLGSNPLNLNVPKFVPELAQLEVRIGFAGTNKNTGYAGGGLRVQARIKKLAVNGPQLGTPEFVDAFKLSKAKTIASKSNNKKLPSEFKLSGDFSNQQVLDEAAKVDNDSQKEELKFSKALDLDKDFNDIIENKTGIASDKTYARVKAEVAGANKGRFNFFIPPSAEDFVGLLYSTLGKGSIGDAQMAWYKAHLLNPFARAMENLANDRVALIEDFKGLKKALKIVPKNLRKKIKDSDFTKEQAVRVAIWDKQGMTVPGMSEEDQKELVDYVDNDADLTIFADQLIAMGKGDAYAAPDGGWVAGTIDTDFIKALNTVKRDKYLEVWQQNVDQIFSESNLNKLEAAYGKPYREAMENMLQRMSTGRNTNSGSDKLTARFTDWLTNSVGALMFFNTRSAVLQTISAVNFVNFSDNNVLKAGAAFANQPQYWKDFKKLFNSPFLLDRRSGLKLNVNEADIADMAKGPGNGARNVIAGILKAGFLPTQLADSFAIASGGAAFYRNRVKALMKEGLTEIEAEEQAFRDFREIAEESQQSSRPDKISQQQAGPLGRVVLAFANTPAQYARLIKKASSDLKNGRGDAKTNISKIIYYGVAQNLLFSALQQALFAIAFDDEEEDEIKNEKYFNIINGMSDSILRGSGIGGAIVSVVKNTAIRLAKEADKKSPKYQDAVVKGVLQISPPVSSKVGKLQSAGRSFSWNQEEMRTRGWSIDNPAYLASANVVSAMTNLPLDRAIKKITNIVDAGNEDIEYYKRVALALGWSAWELGIDKKGGKVAPPKTNMDKLYDLTKKQQIDSLLSLGLSKKQIKLLKLEENRVNAILDPKSIKQIKVSKKDSLFGLNKKDQVQALEKLGFTKKEIKELRLENDRVEAIMNKQKQEN